jgi:hypothetical protein
MSLICREGLLVITFISIEGLSTQAGTESAQSFAWPYFTCGLKVEGDHGNIHTNISLDVSAACTRVRSA